MPEQTTIDDIEAGLLADALGEDDLLPLFQALVWRLVAAGLPLDRASLHVGAEATLARGQRQLGSIRKQGDRYLRSLFTAGALAVIRHANIDGTKHRPWLTALLALRPTSAIALARQHGLAA